MTFVTGGLRGLVGAFAERPDGAGGRAGYHDAMRLALKLHPDSVFTAATRIEVEASRRPPGLLQLDYRLTGEIGAVRLPEATGPARADGLWRHTCFEAFVQAAGEGGYLEFNLSPSTQWAAWRFDAYRAGMRELGGLPAPRIDVRFATETLELTTTLDLGGLAELPAAAPWRLGLSAVIEAADGSLAYWALAHPPGRADFHHGDSFAYDLPAEARA